MLVRKLRIYAILQRLIELEQERKQRIRNQFLPKPIFITVRELMPDNIFCYDKKGKLLENPKSKYHK
jgi:hypothetical protein